MGLQQNMISITQGVNTMANGFFETHFFSGLFNQAPSIALALTENTKVTCICGYDESVMDFEMPISEYASEYGWNSYIPEYDAETDILLLVYVD